LATATTAPLRIATELCLSLIVRHCIPDTEIEAALILAPEFNPTATPASTKRSKKTPTPTSATVAGSASLDLIEQIEKALTSSRYAASALPHVLALASALFLRLRLRVQSTTSPATRSVPAATTLLSKSLVLVAKMREDERFEWKREAEEVLASAIKVCGPEWILSIMPLGLEEGSNPARARAWLLPLLRPAITNTRLSHFKEVFVPLSAYLFSKAEAARAGERGMEAKVWETLVGQIWALLSGYCEVPIDLVEAFDTDFVSLLANILYSQPSLRPSIFRALSTLLASAVSTASSTAPPELLFAQFGLTPADGQRDLTHLKSLSSSILGVSFNVYGKLQKGEGAFVLECVGNWMGVLPASDVASTYDRIEGLLIQALAVPLPKPQKGHGAPKPKDVDADVIPATHALLDILVTLIPHAAPVETRLFDLACSESVLGSGDHAVQKKGYRILSRLAEERNGSVINGRVGEVIEQLVESSSSVAMGAKRVCSSLSYLLLFTS
jgi:ribosomal RNA-processing protein 12